MEALCRLIADLPDAATSTQVQEALDPFFAAAPPHAVVSSVAPNSAVTPWIMACDKAQVACLDYLEQRYSNTNNESHHVVLGHPTTRAPDTHNAPVHHAAAANCPAALAILCRLESISVDALLSRRNAHGDTPLMMAAAAGHVNFLQTVVTFLDTTTNLWSLANHDHDTCLTLATRQGHQEVVEWLLTQPNVMVSEAEQASCRAALATLQRALLLQTNRPKHPFLQRHVTTIQRCIHAMDKALAAKAEAVARDLLASEPEVVAPKTKSSQRKTRKPKTHAKTPLRPKEEKAVKDGNKNNQQNDTDEMNIVTTLQDGRRAVRVQGSSLDDESVEQSTDISLQATLPKPSLQEMFQQRLQEGTTHNNTHVTEIMHALCLEASMLLYTPHGMALELSPSQLDAVQGILQHQLQTVQQARQLQQRHHATTIMTNSEEERVG